MTATTEHPCEIVPVDRHDGDGVTVEWAIHDPWSDMMKWDGFESAEAAIEWCAKNGYTPDLRQVAEYRLMQNLDVLGPYGAARAVVGHFSVHQLVRFSLEFRRALDDRITAEDHYMDAVSEPS